MTQSPRIISAQVRFLRHRDGDDCWLCLLPINFSITDPDHPMHYSRDHVVPRSRGGSGALANLRLAHRLCNVRRGNSWDGKDAPDSVAVGERWRDINWDDRMSARQPAGGRVLYLGEESSLPCA